MTLCLFQQAMDARETMGTIRCVFPFPQEVIDHIMWYVVPFVDILEKIHKQIDHHVLAIEHYFRSAYRDCKFYNDNVRFIVLNLFSIERSIGTHLDEYLCRIDTVFRHILTRFGPHRLLKASADSYIDILDSQIDVLALHESNLRQFE